MPKEEAVAAFKALLAEKGVHAFSRYERELPKLQMDKRFKVGGRGLGARLLELGSQQYGQRRGGGGKNRAVLLLWLSR